MGTGESPASALGRLAEDLRGEGDEASVRTVPLRLLGFSLYWAWLFTLIITDMSGTGGLADGALPPSVGEYAMRAASLLAIVVLARRMAPGRFAIGAAKAAMVLGPVGVVLLALGEASGDASSMLGLAAWIPIGIADALLLVGWLDFYRSLGLRRAIIVIGLASLLSVPVLLVASALHGPTAVAFVAALPVLCGLALRTSQASDPPAAPRPEGEAPAVPLRSIARFAKVFVLIAAYGLAFGTMQALTYSDSSGSIPFGLRALAICLGTLLSLAVSLAAGASKVNAVYRIVLPIFACGFLLIPLLGEDFTIAGCLAIVGFRLFDILSIIILLRLVALHDLPATATFGIGRLANTVGMFAGWMVASFVAGSFAPNGAALASTSAILLLILMVTSGSLLSVEGMGEEGGPGRSDEPGDDRRQPSTEMRGRWRRQCELVCTQYGLSPRESEVLVLLAKGRDAVYISTLFVISPHTAKTHIHNVYKKLGIHSQQELIDLVEEAAHDLKDTAGT